MGLQSHNEETDESLMVRVSRGDQQAFAILVHRHTDRFFRAAFRTCGNTGEAEDIVQEAFLKLWNGREKWDPSRGARFTTWFYRVVVNQALDQMRRRKPETGTDMLDHFSDKAPAQDDAMSMAQEQAVLEEAIQSLPERQRTALNLCFYEELSNKDAAAVMGVGVKALESLLMRAKQSLKERLVQNDNVIKREKKYGQAI